MASCDRKFGLVFAAALALAQPAAANDSSNPQQLAARFVDALQQQRFQDAAGMFAPATSQESAATAARLKRVGERIGGFATMRNVVSLPDGTSIKLEIPAGDTLFAKSHKFYQVNYRASAADGKPVFYVLALETHTKPQRVLSFAVHLPSADASSTARASEILRELAH